MDTRKEINIEKQTMLEDIMFMVNGRNSKDNNRITIITTTSITLITTINHTVKIEQVSTVAEAVTEAEIIDSMEMDTEGITKYCSTGFILIILSI